MSTFVDGFLGVTKALFYNILELCS